jgi:hypothetical protein
MQDVRDVSRWLFSAKGVGSIKGSIRNDIVPMPRVPKPTMESKKSRDKEGIAKGIRVI